MSMSGFIVGQVGILFLVAFIAWRRSQDATMKFIAGTSGWACLFVFASIAVVGIDNATTGILLYSGLSGVAIVAGYRIYIAWSEAGDDANHVRGAQLTNAAKVNKQLKGRQSRFTMGGVNVPIDIEPRNFLLAGSPGTGKSQALTIALDSLITDKAMAIIADASGIYCQRYYDSSKNDVILNPLDARSVKWSPLAEIKSAADIASVCKSLMPDGEGESRQWTTYAQECLDAIISHVYANCGTNGDIYHLAVAADMKELRQVFAGTPAAALVTEGNDRMFGSVRGTLSEAMRAFKYLDKSVGAANSFSIVDHIARGGSGIIFLTYQQQHRAALARLIASCIDVAARSVLMLPPKLDRRVVFALDELPLLGKINSIVELATNGRKHGAVIFAGLQTISQLRELYGRETAQTLLACLGSWLILQIADAETAEYMSKQLGDTERKRVTQSGGSSETDSGGSVTSNWSEQIHKDKLILASQLQGLESRIGYLRLASMNVIAHVAIPIAPEQKQAPAYIAAPMPKSEPKPEPKPTPKPEPKPKSRQADFREMD